MNCGKGVIVAAFKEIYNEQYVADLGSALQAVDPGFDAGCLAARVFDEHWQARELKDRARHITLVLGGLLPQDFRLAVDILRRAAPALARYGFENIVLSDYVAVHGLDDWEAALPALEQFTQNISAEYAVRPFIVRDQARMMAHMLAWAGHHSADVRRLASEGCRPLLPWGIRLPGLQADPAPILPILEKLQGDQSEWVRRSVANNLNDISKDNPDLVLDLLRRWRAGGGPETAWIVNHALRTLVKAGHPGALELLGFGPAALDVHDLAVEPAVIPMGGEVTFSFAVDSTANRPQELMIDYIVHLVRANGTRTPKVFKLSRRTLNPGETLRIARRHSFAPVTTRRYYPGEHAIEPQINGTVFGSVTFHIEEEEKGA